jgi:hypothetical protein
MFKLFTSQIMGAIKHRKAQISAFMFMLMAFAVIGVSNVSAAVSTSTIGNAVDGVGDTIWDVLTDIILAKVFLIIVGLAVVAFLLRTAINWVRGGGKRA